jgi:hypothetical protein
LRDSSGEVLRERTRGFHVINSWLESGSFFKEDIIQPFPGTQSPVSMQNTRNPYNWTVLVY